MSTQIAETEPFAIPGTLNTPRSKMLRAEYALTQLELMHWPEHKRDTPEHQRKGNRLAKLEELLAHEWIRSRGYMPPTEPCLTRCFEFLFGREATPDEIEIGLWGFCLSCVPV